jgi:hypothetical protein
MSFCHLAPGQTAALMFILSVKYNDKAPQKIKDAIANNDWHHVTGYAWMMAPDGVKSPTDEDFSFIGGMRPGLQNANFVLAMADVKADTDGKAKLQLARKMHRH